ncbi:MAG: hypothetical protein ABIK92_15540 [Pseudomonadota bacterium]
MKQLTIIKCLTVFILIFFMGNFAYGDTVSLPDPLKLVAESKYYVKITKDQAAEIIEICTSDTYRTRSIVDKDNFFMDVPKDTIAHPLVLKRKKSFKWSEVKHIQLLQKSVKITYANSFLGITSHDTLEIDPHKCNLSDLALAAITLSGLPLSSEKPVFSESIVSTVKTPTTNGLNLEESLSKLQESYNQGLFSEVVWESKQNELIDSILKEFYNKGLISKTVYESRQKELPGGMLAK